MEPKILPPGSGQAINVIGDTMLIRLTGADTGGVFTLVEQTNAPGVGIPMHVHKNEDELFHIIEGSIAFTVGDQSLVASAGTTVFLPRDLPHAWKVVGDSTVKNLVHVFPAGAEKMWQELSALPPGEPPDMAQVVAICARFGVTFLPPQGD
jgi:quercetin dioxygenase-like cupin family protein